MKWWVWFSDFLVSWDLDKIFMTCRRLKSGNISYWRSVYAPPKIKVYMGFTLHGIMICAPTEIFQPELGKKAWYAITDFLGEFNDEDKVALLLTHKGPLVPRFEVSVWALLRDHRIQCSQQLVYQLLQSFRYAQDWAAQAQTAPSPG
jgi:hypothetical protein